MMAASTKHSSTAYRPEIDGLRSVAVIAVLWFHFFPKSFPLGYLGVDVFFVISGYLITSYILESSRLGTFTFSEFYWRRIKRILPVTLAVLAVTALVSSILLTPPDLARFSESLAATMTFTANIYFWRSGGYFGVADEMKPLLHMWSLGVEEQFYLIFPAILVVALRYLRGKHAVLALLIVVTASSLALNILLDRLGGANPAFFLLPTRAWHFGFGAVAATIYSAAKDAKYQIVTVSAVALICIGFFYRLPIVPAGFLPTLGTALLVGTSVGNKSVVFQVLTFKPVRFIGLISFSLYLWHWPILVFTKYAYIDPPPAWLLWIGIAATVFLSALSYYFIETPFRRHLTRQKVLGWVGTVSLILFAAAAGLWSSDGIKSRYPALVTVIAEATQTNFRCQISEYIPYGASRACIMNGSGTRDYSLALVGNSHAQMYVPALSNLLKTNDERGILVPLNGCLPTTDLNLSAECAAMAKTNLDAILKDQNTKTIVLGSTWYADSYETDEGVKVADADHQAIVASFMRLIDVLEANGRTVYVIGPISIPGVDLPSILSRKLAFGFQSEQEVQSALKRPRAEFDAEFANVIAVLSARLGDRFIAAHTLLCDQEFCHFGDSKGMYFADPSHLSRSGATKMGPLFDSALMSH